LAVYLSQTIRVIFNQWSYLTQRRIGVFHRIGVIGIGLILSVIIAITALLGHKYRLGTGLLNSALVLAGVVTLRIYLLYAGQIFTG
jgi:polysulfide reductase chain C